MDAAPEPVFPAWALMWTLAAVLFAACKGLALANAPAAAAHASRRRNVGFLMAWPGTDAAAFLDARVAARPDASEWLAATAKTTLGVLLFWFAARQAPHPLLQAWIGAFGLIFMLHFGSFHLLSLAWRQAGVGAQPLMRSPLLAGSLSDLWARRWNLAFHQLAAATLFKPVRERFGVGVATFATFFASGLIHDLVISVPAGGGYGLPTLYFLLQAGGLAAERSATGRRLGLGRGTLGRAWTAAVAGVPVVILFHPWFMLRVLVPFMHAVGAL
jgi:membrane bound O-acyltransferase family protein